MGVDDRSPGAFLRARRPEKFSDSVTEENPRLDRSLLEHHLASITSRKQEAAFEVFARRLVEREICPNLLPQTGPTGGGDSKVDSETYPVADALAFVWYTGIGQEAASERWAFAFSAKKKWRDKVRSDVCKLVGTHRGYVRTFFVTNQFVSDRDRAAMEDELREAHGIDVRIFDLTWILDRVFEGGHEDLAVEELGLSPELRPSRRKGPNDVEREGELEQVEDRIERSATDGIPGLPVVDDALRAAILSRELERPRTETDGRFDRADRMASRWGSEHQAFMVAYQRAWTAFWYHDDIEEFLRLYPVAEQRAKGTQNPHELECLTNLWYLLHSAVSQHGANPVDVDFDSRTADLDSRLQEMAEMSGRPSAALQARTLALQLELLMRITRGEPVGEILEEFVEIIPACSGLAGFPFEPLRQIVVEMGRLLPDVPEYEELFNAVVAAATIREGEMCAARMLMARGEQQLEAERPYEAIRLLGRALCGLFKEESRTDAVRALYGCAHAYERVGLLWAARGTLLSAASLASSELALYGHVTIAQAICYSRLKWIELQLGRVPCALAWHEVDLATRQYLIAQGYDEEQLLGADYEFDFVLGMLLLRTELGKLPCLTKLPDVLERLSLGAAAACLLYALGHEGQAINDDWRAAMGTEDPRQFFAKWRDNPNAQLLPGKPLFYDTPEAVLRSHILGCDVEIVSQSVSPCIEVAESLIAALEALLSTGVTDHLLAHEPRTRVMVKQLREAEHPFSFEVTDEGGIPGVVVTCAEFDPHNAAPDVQSALRDRTFEVLTALISRLLLIENPKTLLHKLLVEEMALDRSLSFTGSFVTAGNVLGSKPRLRIGDWTDGEPREYPLLRSDAWDACDTLVRTPTSPLRSRAPTPGTGDPPAELMDLARVRHDAMRVFSPIRLALWNEAGWEGVGYFHAADGSFPPLFAFLFRNAAIGVKIFEQWHDEFGDEDSDDSLRITIVRSISRRHPHWYRVSVGPNPEIALSQHSSRLFAFISRINTMEPTSGTNLSRFLLDYGDWGCYSLAPATMAQPRDDFEIPWSHQLLKHHLHVREAWEIGRHDPDMAAIYPDDDPSIPVGQHEAPVLELIRWKRDLRRANDTQ